MKKTLLASAASILVISSFQTHAYQFEAGLYHSKADADGGILDLDSSDTTLVGSYYFKDVKASAGPLSEATFIERTSNVSVSYTDGEIEVGPLDYDTDERTISGRYVHAQSGWFGEVGYSEAEVDRIDTEVDVYTLEVGKYVAKYTTLAYRYSKADLDQNGSSDDEKAHALVLEHLQPMDNGMYWGVDAQLLTSDAEDSDDNTNAYSFTAKLYPINELMLGVGMGRSDSDNGDVDSYSLQAEWFVTQNIGLSLRYSSSDESGSNTVNVDTDTWTAGFRARF